MTTLQACHYKKKADSVSEHIVRDRVNTAALRRLTMYAGLIKRVTLKQLFLCRCHDVTQLYIVYLTVTYISNKYWTSVHMGDSKIMFMVCLTCKVGRQLLY